MISSEFTEMKVKDDCGIQNGLEGANICIIGAGKMARLLLVHLQTQGVKTVTIVNRSPDKVLIYQSMHTSVHLYIHTYIHTDTHPFDLSYYYLFLTIFITITLCHLTHSVNQNFYPFFSLLFALFTFLPSLFSLLFSFRC